MCCKHAVTLLCLVLFSATRAAAQTTPAVRPAAGYASGGVLLSMQVAGKSDCPYLCDPFGGIATGLEVGGGVNVGERLTVGAELSRGGVLSGFQHGRTICGGTVSCETVHRDTIGNVVLRFSPAAAGNRRTPMWVVGGGIAFRRTTRAGGSSGEERLDDIVPALLAGLDVPVRVSRRTAVVPFARGHFLLDGDRTDDAAVKRGVSSFIFRTGATIEVRF
jgi:hypothetical protein